jgi:purine-binding chemotaxis protein CheW
VTTAESLKLVCFTLHGQEYGADIGEVKETIALRPITRVFLTPPWLAGIMNLRGDVIAVLDVAQLIGLAPALITATSRILVARACGRVAGILVDALADMRAIPPEALAPSPALLSPEAASYLRGIAMVEDGRAVRVLDISSLLDAEPLVAFRRRRANG